MNPTGPSTREEGHSHLPWRRIAFWFLASRTLIVALGWTSTYIIVQGPAERSRDLLLLLNHWDAQWYVKIAQTGYYTEKEGLLSVNFFPLYPLLIHALAFIVRDARVSAYVLSNACLLFASGLLWKLACREDTEEVADRTVLFFLFNPVSFFYSAPFSESLFALLLLAMAWFANQRQWLRSGVCGCLLSATRPVGIVAIVLLIAEFAAPYLKYRGKKESPRWPDRGAPAFLISLVLATAGLAAYCAYLALQFGDPLAFTHAASSHWHHYLRSPWFSFFDPKFGAFYRRWFQSAVVAGLALIGLGTFLRLRASYLLMIGVFLFVYLSTAHLEAMPRYLSVLFPFYIIVARACVQWPRLEPVLFAGSTLLLALSTILFVNGYWFT